MFGLVFAVAGVVGSLGAGVMLRRHRRDIGEFAMATGRIVEILESDVDGQRVYQPVVEFAAQLKLVGREAVMDKLVYTATNPVQAHLVERAHQWPGVNGLSAALGRRPVRARRPWHFFRPEGPMPKDVEMRSRSHPSLGPRWRCWRSCGSVFARWNASLPGSASVQAAGWLDGGLCLRRRGAVNLIATRLVGTCDRV